MVAKICVLLSLLCLGAAIAAGPAGLAQPTPVKPTVHQPTAPPRTAPADRSLRQAREHREAVAADNLERVRRQGNQIMQAVMASPPPAGAALVQWHRVTDGTGKTIDGVLLLRPAGEWGATPLVQGRRVAGVYIHSTTPPQVDPPTAVVRQVALGDHSGRGGVPVWYAEVEAGPDLVRIRVGPDEAHVHIPADTARPVLSVNADGGQDP